MSNAECLAALLVHHLRVPGAPFIYTGNNSLLEMKTMLFSFAAPEWRISDIVTSQLAKRYNLPNFASAGITDAKTVDAQAGAEWAYTIVLDIMSGANVIHDIGYTGSGMIGCLESMVICNEIIGIAKRIVAGFEINEQTLALDLIDKVGPGGDFLVEDHTLERFQDVWYPTVFDRHNLDQWQQLGSKDMVARARDRVDELLK